MIEVYSPTIRRREMDAVLTALVEDKVGPGDYARRLIQTAKECLGFDYCLALRSPALALYFALGTLALERGREVLISALSPAYYRRVIAALGLVPRLCDVAAGTPCLGPATVEAALKEASLQAPGKCGAIVAHHTLGFVPPSLAEFGLPVIEDASQSYGSTLTAGEEAGARGALVILGLEERDLITAGGGALLYGMNRRDAAALRSLGELPAEYGLPDMNAAMAAVQFKEAERNRERRREIAAVYTQSSLRGRHKGFSVPDGLEYNHYAFPLVLETGVKDVKAYAKKKDIVVESAFEQTPAETCPESYSLSLRTVLFPLYPRLSAVEVEKVSKLILTLP